METTPYIQSRADLMRGISFVKAIEQRLREGWNPDKMQQAMRGTYDNFAPSLRNELDIYLTEYINSWLNPMMSRHEMHIVYISSIEDMRANAPFESREIPDERLDDMFNIMFMKITRLAYIHKDIRKGWGIKKGWFS